MGPFASKLIDLGKNPLRESGHVSRAIPPVRDQKIKRERNSTGTLLYFFPNYHRRLTNVQIPTMYRRDYFPL